MRFPDGAAQQTSFESACQNFYDVVIVGSGISGAIIANELSHAGFSVLIVEAGPAEDITVKGYEKYLQRFYEAFSKDNQSPYPISNNARMPRGSDTQKIFPGQPDSQPSTSGYLVQNGPFATDTTYTRVLGGTTMHWEAKVIRMLPNDFNLQDKYQQGNNWPLNYDDLEPYYRKAEFEIGVSADIEEQKYLGLHYPDNYVFPMKGLPLSYLDQQVDKGLMNTSVELDGKTYPLKVRKFPQGRNGIPNSEYTNEFIDNYGKGYTPIGAVSTNQVEEGQRCQGNNNCVPLCPVQAKYHAGKTLSKALQTKKVDLIAQSVASKVIVNAESGKVSAIEVKHYADPIAPGYVSGQVKGKLFVLAANAIENARLLLASNLPSSSGLVGRNFMDHAYLLNWGLMPKNCGTMRGTNCTGGIVELRDGSFRRRQAAFSVDIHNDGWGWAVGSPFKDLINLVDAENKFGAGLRTQLADRVSRQLQLAFMIEVLPNPSNRVSVNPAYTDQLGNMKPVISNTVPEYTLRGAAYARQFAQTIFQRLGAADYTSYDPTDYGYVTYEGEGYIIRGGNHLAGTHVMGCCAKNSVVNADGLSWDHSNLYLAGGGNLPSIGTSNVTLTIAALCFKSAEAMIKHLNQ